MLDGGILADHSRPRVLFGTGVVERAGAILRELGARRVLVVTDPGIVEAGHVERLERLCGTSGIQCARHASVHENPTTDDVGECLEAARAFDPDVFVGLGGGSSMDVARAADLVLVNGGSITDYPPQRVRPLRPLRPLVQIPTTAGTGSEMQSFALIADPVSHAKRAYGAPEAAAAVALLDPELTVTQPRQVTCNTGADAIVHALETAVTTRRNPTSLRHSREAFVRLDRSFLAVLDDPGDLDWRAGMLLGAALAGAAIEHSMLGAAHAAANPLTARFGVVHGRAVGLMAPHVIRFNAADPAARSGYRDLAVAAQLAGPEDDDQTAARKLADRIAAVLAAAGISGSLADHGVGAAALGELARRAATQWTARFNPRPVGVADFERLYAEALAG